LASGFDDGVVCLLDLDKSKGKSIKRAVYNSKGDPSGLPLGQGQYDDWDE